MRRIEDAGPRFLTKEELEFPVPLRIHGSDDVRVYQAAFSHSDILPWDTETLNRLGRPSDPR